ncbi:MAG: trypsin-like peptidase domain-containing protein [Acidimicrobiia bacterium]
MRSRKHGSRRLGLSVLLVVLALVTAACGGSDDAAEGSETSVVETADANKAVKALEDVRGAVVRIEAQGSFDYPGEGTSYNQGSSGSGFFISPDGVAVTNNHVVTGAAFLQVYVDGEDEPRNAKILGVSECSDLAVIDVEGEGFEYLAWYADEIAVGVNVYAAGFPLGDHEYTLLDGIVSKENADGETNWASVDKVIEHTSDILPGSSGGPLVTDQGRVVGVNYAGDDQGQTYAIGYDEARQVIPKLQAGEDVTSIGINGSAVLTNDSSGIWVYSVASGSPADLVGIRGGDIVSEIEGLIPATDGTMSDYCDVLRSHNPDSAIQIAVWRDSDLAYLEGTLNTDKTLALVGGGTAAGSTPETTAASGAAGQDLAVGDCIDDDQMELYMSGSAYSLAACADPHDNEVYYVHDFGDAAYPGEDAVIGELRNLCLSEFEGYVGRDYETSVLEYTGSWPDETLWNSGYRNARCLVYEMDLNKLTGSAYQSGW